MIKITLWGENADQFEREGAIGKALAITGARVTKFRGKHKNLLLKMNKTMEKNNFGFCRNLAAGINNGNHCCHQSSNS